MKSAWVVVVLVCVLLAGSAWAQIPFGFTPRSMGMGFVGVGLADDSAAWFQNPAGLAGLDVPVQPGHEWANDLSASFIKIGGPGTTLDAGRISWAACKPSSNVGVGAGYANVNSVGRAIGAGVGAGVGIPGLSLGVNVVNLHAFGGPDETLLNGGAMYRIMQGGGKGPIRVGFVATNLTNELGAPTFLNAGASWPITGQLTLAGDAIDLAGDALGVTFNGGAEFKFGPADRRWSIRAGMVDLGLPGIDSQITAGAGLSSGRWRVDGAWVQQLVSGFNSTWTIGGGLNF